MTMHTQMHPQAHINNLIMQCPTLGLVERLNESTPLSQDYSDTLTSTGDSGFSDSREFRKDPLPVMTQKVPAQHELLTDPDSEYAALIKSDVQPPGYYKSTTKRENIPGTKLSTS